MINRRRFLQSSLGSVGLMPWLSNGLLAGATATKRTSNHVLVCVQAGGGLDMLSMWVPYGVPEYQSRRGVNAYAAPGDLGAAADRRCLDAEPGRGIGFGPGMTELQSLYARGDVAVVQKVGYPIPSRSHFTSLQIWRYGQRDLAAAVADPRGWLARFGDEDIATPSAVVGFNTPAFLEFKSRDGTFVLLDSLDVLVASETDPELRLLQGAMDRVAADPAQLATGPIWDTARRTAALRTDLDARLASYNGSTIYPNSRLANSLREAARLITADNGTRAVFVSRSGPSVDTHSDQFNRLGTIRPEIDGALGAFVRDLEVNGVFDRVTIVLFSEFGRTLDTNGSLGLDHGHANHMFVIDGQIQGGPKGNDVSSSDLSAGRFLPVEIDFREVFAEIGTRRMGVDLTTNTFAETFATTPGGLGI